MSWILFTLLAYLVNAVAFIIDKYLLSFHIPRPFAYAFWVSVLSIFALVLIPFGVNLQDARFILIAFLSGFSFFVGLVFLYKAIKATDVSIASTMSGVATAIFSYFLATLIINEPSGVLDLTAILILISGMFLLGRSDKNSWPIMILSGFLFSVSFVLLKITFDLSDFVNGIFWTRMGFVVAAVGSLVFTPLRDEVSKSLQGTHLHIGAVFIGNKVLATLGFMLLYYAIKIGEVSKVNSFLGFQFLFIFILAIIFKIKNIKIETKLTKADIIKKAVGIGLITIGFLTVIMK